jgi:predicted solute-binding protein
MLKTRIAVVRYLNTRPLIEGLERAEGIELTAAAPSHIADMIRSGAADIGLASIVDAVSGGVPLAVLPVGMIGCDGPTMTVRLYSSRPLEQITHLHADTESHTSIALCQVILRDRLGRSPEIVAFNARERISASGPEEWPEAMLLIGDKVVTDSPPAVRYPHQLDLGEAWHEMTGLPFVYASWMCRVGEAGSPRIAAAAALLDRQLRHNLGRLEWLIRTRAPEHHWPGDLAHRYVGELLRYRMGDREREAVERFLREAAAMGLAPDRPVVWADWRGALAGRVGVCNP